MKRKNTILGIILALVMVNLILFSEFSSQPTNTTQPTSNAEINDQNIILPIGNYTQVSLGDQFLINISCINFQDYVYIISANQSIINFGNVESNLQTIPIAYEFQEAGYYVLQIELFKLVNISNTMIKADDMRAFLIVVVSEDPFSLFEILSNHKWEFGGILIAIISSSVVYSLWKSKVGLGRTTFGSINPLESLFFPQKMQNKISKAVIRDQKLLQIDVDNLELDDFLKNF